MPKQNAASRNDGNTRPVMAPPVEDCNSLEECLQCHARLAVLTQGERSVSQMQCDLCARKEMECWLKNYEALTEGRITPDEHEQKIAEQVMRAPRLHKGSVVEWARKRTGNK